MAGRVLVLGSKGMLGHILSDILAENGLEVLLHTRSMYNPLEQTVEELTKVWREKPEYLINCLVHTHFRENNDHDIWKLNSLFPRQLAMFCESNAIKLIQISTNGVFSGERGNYTEKEIPDATDAYGMSKFFGEDGLRAMVIRTSIIGHEQSNKKYLLEWALGQAGKQINGYTNHFWNGLTTLELSNQLLTLIKQNQFERGIFHFHAPTVVSKYELIKSINQIYQLGIEIRAIEAVRKDDKTLNSLNFGNSVKDIILQIKELYSFVKNKNQTEN